MVYFKVQKVCLLYEDIIKLSQRKVTTLERDVKTFKEHTDSLRTELTAACNRLVITEIPTGRPLVGEINNKNETFVPLLANQHRRSPRSVDTYDSDYYHS